MTRRFNALASLVLATLLLAGCSQREPATQAVTAAEDALAAVSDDAQKYIPQRYAEVKAQLDEARAALERERFTDALAGVEDIPAQAQALAEEANAAREQLAAELAVEWTRLTDQLPGRIATVEDRVDELGKLRRLPQELDAEAVERARSSLEVARSGWTQAVEAFEAQNLEGAAARGLEVERLVAEIREALGLEPQES